MKRIFGSALLLMTAAFLILCFCTCSLAARNAYPVGSYAGEVQVSHKTVADYPKTSNYGWTDISFYCDDLVLFVYSDGGAAITGEVTGHVVSDVYKGVKTDDYVFPIDAGGFSFTEREPGQTQTVTADCDASVVYTKVSDDGTKASQKTHDGEIAVTLTTTERGFDGYATFQRLDMGEDYFELRLDFTFPLAGAATADGDGSDDPFAGGGIPVGYGTPDAPTYDTEGMEGIESVPSETMDGYYEDDWNGSDDDNLDDYADFYPDDYEPYYPEGYVPDQTQKEQKELSLGTKAAIAAGGTAALGAAVAAILKATAAKKAAAAAAQAASRATVPEPETYRYEPEVSDWRGSQIDENARVQQKHEEYIQANRDAQAEYDAIRRAEEAARRQHEAEQNRMLDELIRISQRLSTTTRDAAWKMNEITHRQIDTASAGKALDPATVKRIKDGFGDLAKGNIIGEDAIPPMPTDAQLAVRAYEDAFEEVCRNETATAAAARTVSSALSGGASDKLFQAGKGFYRMKDYIDAGGDSGMGAVSYAMFGEARDRAIGRMSDKAMGKLPFTPKGKSLPQKIMYDQRKRYVKQAVNATDKATAGTNDKALRFIRWIFE